MGALHRDLIFAGVDLAFVRAGMAWLGAPGWKRNPDDAHAGVRRRTVEAARDAGRQQRLAGGVGPTLTERGVESLQLRRTRAKLALGEPVERRLDDAQMLVQILGLRLYV